METVEVLRRIRKEISEIQLTSWDYDNKLYDVDGQTVQLKAIRIIDKYLSGKGEEYGNS